MTIMTLFDPFVIRENPTFNAVDYPTFLSIQQKGQASRLPKPGLQGLFVSPLQEDYQ
jgi:hypothetical protein